MSEKLSRRSFFRLAGGGIAAAVIAPQVLLDKVLTIPVEFGWTWYVDKSKIPPTLSELVASTLRQNTQKIAENVTANNSLLMKLKDGIKVNLQIDNISIEEQNKRMGERTRKRLEERDRIKIDEFKKKQKEYWKSHKSICIKQLEEVKQGKYKNNQFYDEKDQLKAWEKALAHANSKLVELHNGTA